MRQYPLLTLPSSPSLQVLDLTRVLVCESRSVGMHVENIFKALTRQRSNHFNHHLSLDLEYNSVGSQGPVAAIGVGLFVDGEPRIWIFHISALFCGCVQSISKF